MASLPRSPPAFRALVAFTVLSFAFRLAASAIAAADASSGETTYTRGGNTAPASISSRTRRRQGGGPHLPGPPRPRFERVSSVGIDDEEEDRRRYRYHDGRQHHDAADAATTSDATTSNHRSSLGSGGTSSSLPSVSSVLDAVDPRIINGVNAQLDRFPYMASLGYFGSHICGGSLVASDVVLSAAHCSGYTTGIRFGRSSSGEEEDIPVAYEVKHPGYSSVQVDNDFMIIKLIRPVGSKPDASGGSGGNEGNATIPTPPLLNLNPNPAVPVKDDLMAIMGWGDTDEDPDQSIPSQDLMEADVSYITNNQCRSAQGYIEKNNAQIYVAFGSMISFNMMCAWDAPTDMEEGEEQQDTCQGDSGGPMIYKGDTWEDDLQVGVVSWGIGCKSEIFPGVYSRVSAQYAWIQQMICEHAKHVPPAYECDEVGGGDLNNDEANNGRSYVTIEVSLDGRPALWSWALFHLDGDGNDKNDLGSSGTFDPVASVPTDFYYGYINVTYHHKIQLDDANKFYRLSLFREITKDPSDDRDAETGSIGGPYDGYVAAYRGSRAVFANLVMYEPHPGGGGGNGEGSRSRVDHAFYTGPDPPAYLSLQLIFDPYPPDVWWKLEHIEDGVVLGQRSTGWYGKEFEQKSIVERVSIYGNSDGDSSPQRYRFTIGDSYFCDDTKTSICGDGICCEYGSGGYKLYGGKISDGVVLAQGGQYGTSEVTEIEF